MLNKIKCFPWFFLANQSQSQITRKEERCKNKHWGWDGNQKNKSKVRSGTKKHDVWLCLSTTKGFSLEADIQRI